MSKFVPMSYDELHPGRFMKAHQLGGKPRTFTVTSYVAEDMAPEGAEKPDIKGILSFKEIKEQYATQKTNEALLRAMFGKNPQDVVGKRVTLFPSTDTFGREKVDAIRIYGSPHITEEITVKVEYAKKSRRAPKTFVLRPVKVDGAAPNEALDIEARIKAAASAEDIEAIASALADARARKSIPPVEWNALTAANQAKKKELATTALPVSDTNGNIEAEYGS